MRFSEFSPMRLIKSVGILNRFGCQYVCNANANNPDSISIQKQIYEGGCVIKKFILTKLLLFPTERSPSDLELVLTWTFLCDRRMLFLRLLLSLSLFISLRLLLSLSFPCRPRFFHRATDFLMKRFG